MMLFKDEKDDEETAAAAAADEEQDITSVEMEDSSWFWTQNPIPEYPTLKHHSETEPPPTRTTFQSTLL